MNSRSVQASAVIFSHGPKCWRKPGHQGCALAVLESLDGNLVDAFVLRGSMITKLSQKAAELTIDNQRLRDRIAGRR